MKKILKINSFIGKMLFGLIGVALLLTFVPQKNTYAQTVPNIPLCEITRNLTIGSVGEDVQCLQRYLNWAGFTVASSGVGSSGNETQYFGTLSANAVVRWQNANSAQVLTPLGLSSGTGYWGPSSFNQYVTIVRTALGV